VLLFGVSLLYGASGGVVHLEQLAKALDGADPKFDSLARAGVVLTLAGLAFKVAAVPFHFWVPDTYRGAPVPVAAFLSVVSKTAGFGALILVAGIALKPYAHVWGPAFAVLAALTMTVGNLVALRQTDAVRLLAWSSVAQSGYVLVPFGAQGDLQETLPSAVAYLAVYAVMNLGAFAVVVLVGGKNVEDYRALARSRPGAAIALGFFLLGLAGLPPGLMGLFAKVTVFQAVVGAGTGWLAVVMAVNVVIALYYYLVWTAVLFGPVKHSRPALPQTPGQLALGTRTSVPVTFAVGALVALGAMLSVAPQLVLRVLSVPGLIR
jgi:NADH-quinone oxidoreductase subunit N